MEALRLGTGLIAVAPRFKFETIPNFGAIIVSGVLREQSDLLFGEQTNLFASSLELFEGMVTAEELADEELKAVLDLRLLGHRDAAADSRAANQDHESDLEHLSVVQEESHVREGAGVAGQHFRIA